MPVVFVHGNPDTAAVWAPLRALLPEFETVALGLPGWDGPPLEGVAGTRWDLRAWLIEQLEAIGEPVDLVGHDLGSLLVQGVLVERPDLIRSWVLSSGVADGDYAWHTQARIWQTTGLGEQSRELWFGLPESQRAMLLETSGIPAAFAGAAAEHFGRPMFDALLPFYRSAVWLGDWELPADVALPPGKVLWGTRDPFVPVALGRRVAERAGAEFVELDCGHWWQLERPAEGAAALWAGVATA